MAGKRSLRRRIASSLSYVSTLFTELAYRVNSQKNERQHTIQGSGLLRPQEHLVTAITVRGDWPLGNYPSIVLTILSISCNRCRCRIRHQVMQHRKLSGVACVRRERHTDRVDAKKGRTQPIRRVSGGRHVPFTSSRKRARPQVMDIPPTPASRQHYYHTRQTESSTRNPCTIRLQHTLGNHQTPRPA